MLGSEDFFGVQAECAFGMMIGTVNHNLSSVSSFRENVTRSDSEGWESQLKQFLFF